MTNDRQILEGFLRGDGAACRELLTRLRPACLGILLKQHLHLVHAHDEILDAVESTLIEWRSTHLGGEQRFDLDESVTALAWRLTKQEAKHESRYLKRNKLSPRVESKEMKNLSVRAEAGDRVEADDLMREIGELPGDMAATLVAEAQRVLNDGPPLAEQLGVTPDAARKRLERARRELRIKLWGRKDEE